MKRSLEVTATGAQSFEQRYPGKRRRLDDDIPPTAPWRCNLTGLSQERNLYFVAHGAAIYVYTPDYPAQTIAQPALVIPCEPTGLGSHNWLDYRFPHCINNLLVAQLGTDEIIAVVRDCGDLDVFLTRHISAGIEARKGPSTLSIVADELKHIFQANVGISAWGLAVHSQARIIAVSSNAHEVTIFKFGLVTEDERRSDVTQQVFNGECNIPCIAFCNTGDDPEAQWLLTTDINGVCRTLDLKRSMATQVFRFGRQVESVYGAGFDRLNAGWAIMFLDSRSFVREHSMQAANGMAISDELPDAKDNPHIWDLSKTVRRIDGVNTAFIRHQPDNKHHKHMYVNQSIEQSSRRMQATSDTDIDVEIFEEISIVDDDLSGSDGPGLPDLVDDEDFEDEGTEDTTPASAYYGGERICGNLPRFQQAAPLCNRLPCPILHASVRNLYLLQPTTNQHSGPWQAPFIGIASPLKQSIQIEYHDLNLFDRMNMSAYIQDLGVVVVASQKGRAVVLALTKLDRSTQYPNNMLDLGTRTVYSFRAEAILPFESQEKLNQRPFSPLHGLAVGPVQRNHTVLSYEIARSCHDGVLVI